MNKFFEFFRQASLKMGTLSMMSPVEIAEEGNIRGEILEHFVDAWRLVKGDFWELVSSPNVSDEVVEARFWLELVGFDHHNQEKVLTLIKTIRTAGRCNLAAKIIVKMDVFSEAINNS